MKFNNYNNYLKKYLSKHSFSWAVAVNANPFLQKQLSEMHVAECRQHPPFENCDSYIIVKCGKCWVLLGKISLNSKSGYRLENYEMALGQSKEQLAVWADLRGFQYAFS